MRPPTPELHALLKELVLLLDWWTGGPWWHCLLIGILLVLFWVAFCKALASTDRSAVEELIRKALSKQ